MFGKRNEFILLSEKLKPISLCLLYRHSIDCSEFSMEMVFFAIFIYISCRNRLCKNIKEPKKKRKDMGVYNCPLTDKFKCIPKKSKNNIWELLPFD